jgi:hypothetical protein
MQNFTICMSKGDNFSRSNATWEGGNETGQSESSLSFSHTISIHRYLMSRLSLQVYYLWRHVLSTGPPYIMVVKFRNTIGPPPPQLSLHRRAALSSNSNGTRSVYSRENPKSSLYCEMSQSHLTWQYGTKVSLQDLAPCCQYMRLWDLWRIWICADEELTQRL